MVYGKYIVYVYCICIVYSSNSKELVFGIGKSFLKRYMQVYLSSDIL